MTIMKKLIMFGGWMLILIGSTSFISVTKPVEAAKKKCIGYTVIDAHTVQWCDGRIEKKDWQIRIGK
jgi:hypothetical protein